ncbi:dipeptidyl aminopeptidase BI [Tripterygium wilfordii]|uniref:dipeptidyl aminopeptidase BI n=1 Tax=Tripterygium wilfordii TaxID=458696 RepID=UPI0018F814E8|nr:dipeptidyl aminopeptidase BI [Tripterygium wilfordii]
MAIPSLLQSSKTSIQRSRLFLFLCQISTNSSSFFFSTKCRAGLFKIYQVPSQAPPVPKKIPFNVSAHGTTLEDPYHWMRDTSDADFVDFLNLENSYAQAFMADTQDLQRTLFAEMVSRMPAKISTPPERWGPWLYYQYIPEGKEYPVLCRRLETGKSGLLKILINYAREGFEREEVLLDWNKIAEQYGYVHVGTCRVSPDHNFLAYTLDVSGSEQFMLQIKDLRNGCIVPGLQVDGVVSLAWAQDGNTLFYTISDENQRPHRVLCTRLGQDVAFQVPVFVEDDSRFCVDITNTKDGKFITVNSNSRTSSEVYVIDATNPQDGLRRIRKRVSGVQYFLEHHHGLFYILTNAPLNGNKEWSGGNYYLARCQVEDIQSASWQTMIFPSEDESLQDMDIFNRHLVLFINKKGVSMPCSINLPIDVQGEHQMGIQDLNPWFFPLPSNSCSITPGSNHDFMNSLFRVVLTSPVMPDVVVDYDMSKQTFSVVHQEEVRNITGSTGSCLPAFEPDSCEHLNPQNRDRKIQNAQWKKWKEFSDAYCCQRKEVLAHDGAKVPLTIVFSREARQLGQSPGLLLGYGAYGEVLDKSWSGDRLSLLDRGWVVAFADVRGGGGCDSSWHKSGCGLNKLNSIHDFASCGNYLVNEGYVHRDKLGAMAYSAGCLLVGTAVNMYPELFRAAILKVPFLDICNTLLDPSLPLTILDYEEFGNPQIQSQFESILSYSPYNNIIYDHCCPAMLVSSSFHDSRVGIWEAAKWVARIRDSACPDCSRSVILKTNMTGGHFDEGGRYSQCEVTAYDYAFLMKVMGTLTDEV